MKHQERKHSKFSASGSERWLQCPGSVSLSEGIEAKDNIWSAEGTRAHEVLEHFLLRQAVGISVGVPLEMVNHARAAAQFLTNLHLKNQPSDFLFETRISLEFIHPDMFGTFDAAIVDHFGTLHVADFKYGKYLVSPKENLQMIFYGIGLAARYDWNFQRVKLWVIQPRVRGYDGPSFWEIPIEQLWRYVLVFQRGVEAALEPKPKFKEGKYCFFCVAKNICPLKKNAKRALSASRFASEAVYG